LSLSRLSGLNPVVLDAAEYALEIARYFRIRPTVTSGFRSFRKQAQLRAAWEAGRSRFPANRPGDSSHNFGLAWDSTVPAQDLANWNAIRSWVGFELIANDPVHAQVPNWRRYV